MKEWSVIIGNEAYDSLGRGPSQKGLTMLKSWQVRQTSNPEDHGIFHLSQPFGLSSYLPYAKWDLHKHKTMFRVGLYTTLQGQ